MYYTCLRNKDAKNKKTWTTLKKRKHPFFCLNDCFDENDPDKMKLIIEAFQTNFEIVYHTKTPFEI